MVVYTNCQSLICLICPAGRENSCWLQKCGHTRAACVRATQWRHSVTEQAASWQHGALIYWLCRTAFCRCAHCVQGGT
jgi:hypothetical protein